MNGPPGPVPTQHLSFIGEIFRSASRKRNAETLIAATRGTPPCRSLSAGKLRFHQRRYFSHVGAPRELAFQCPHDFAHVGYALCTRLRDCHGDLLRNLGVRQLLRQVAREKIQLEGFTVDEVLAVGRLELRNGVAALLDHFLDHRYDLGVRKLFSLVHFALFDRSEQQAYGREPLRVSRFHGCLHVFADACLQRHALGFLRGGDPQNETARRAALSTPSRRVGPAAGSSGSIEFRRQRLAAQALVVPFDGGGELSLAVGSRLFVELAGAQFGEKPGLFHGPLEAAQRHLERLVFLDAYGRHAVFIPGQCCSKGANSRLFLAETPAACVPYPPSLPVSPRIRNSCPTVAARRSTSVRRASRRERAESINSRREPRPSR